MQTTDITAPHFKGALSASATALSTPEALAVAEKDVLVLVGEESKNGNLGYDEMNINMHDFYLGEIDGCLNGSHSSFGSMAWTVCNWPWVDWC